MLRPVKSAESLVTATNVQRSQSERRTSKAGLDQSEEANLNTSSMDDPEPLDKSLMESHDDLCPLETVSKAVAASNVMKDSPRTHSRSNSHDSYFERRLRNNPNAKNDVEKVMESSLDLSEIQMNFDLEENEMKIFSEDEAMMTNSFDSAGDLTSPLEEDLNLTSAIKLKNDAMLGASPKTRKMSFREKFKRFTSPTQNRKEINSQNHGDESSSSSDMHESSRPLNEINKTEMSLRERIACALSPESLRKRDNQSESSPKKKKSSFSPGTSPNNTSQLTKRSKIEENNSSSEEECQQKPQQEAECHVTSTLPLSPSINFIDASMTESYESTSKFPSKF